jgi:hypothetical protein
LTGIWALWGLFGVEWFARLRHGSSGPISAEELGQTGDLFGGISALFAALAFMGVAIGAYYQNKTWRISERQHVQQSFEPLFFQLMALHREIARDLELEKPHAWLPPLRLDHGYSLGEATGHLREQLGHVWMSILSDQTTGRIYATEGFERLYQINEQLLGTYFRSLYHIFALIDRSRLTEPEKMQYASIARAVLGVDSLFFLLINCLSTRGNGLRQLVNRYGLLKHVRFGTPGGPSFEAWLVSWYYEDGAVGTNLTLLKTVLGKN